MPTITNLQKNSSSATNLAKNSATTSNLGKHSYDILLLTESGGVILLENENKMALEQSSVYPNYSNLQKS